MKVLLSIKPEYVRLILDGTKKFEYRKKEFKENVRSIIVYSTKPEGRLVCELTISHILKGDIEELWEKTGSFSGVEKEQLKRYFNGKNGYAIGISSVRKFKKSIDPHELIRNFTAPQSFRYLTEEESETLEHLIKE